jgi:hypothetical protein
MAGSAPLDANSYEQIPAGGQFWRVSTVTTSVRWSAILESVNKYKPSEMSGAPMSFLRQPQRQALRGTAVSTPEHAPRGAASVRERLIAAYRRQRLATFMSCPEKGCDESACIAGD